MSRSAAPAPQQPAVVPRQVAAVPRQHDAVLPQARGSGLPVAAAIVRLNRAREPRALSTSFRSNEACDRPFGFSRPCETKATPSGTSIDPGFPGHRSLKHNTAGAGVCAIYSVPHTETGRCATRLCAAHEQVRRLGRYLRTGGQVCGSSVGPKDAPLSGQTEHAGIAGMT